MPTAPDPDDLMETSQAAKAAGLSCLATAALFWRVATGAWPQASTYEGRRIIERVRAELAAAGFREEWGALVPDAVAAAAEVYRALGEVRP